MDYSTNQGYDVQYETEPVSYKYENSANVKYESSSGLCERNCISCTGCRFL